MARLSGILIYVPFAMTLLNQISIEASNLNVRMVVEHSKFEAFAAQVFHSGKLWVGTSRNVQGSYYRVDAFAPDGNFLGSIALKHSIRFLYPFNQNSVIAVGISPDPSQSHYTVVSWTGKTMTAQHHPISEYAFADEYTGNPSSMFFTDPGGMQDDPELSANPNLASRTIFSLNWGSPRYLKARIRGPHGPFLKNNSLYVLEHPAIFAGGRNFVRVDLATEKTTVLFTWNTNDLRRMLPLSGTELVAFSASQSNEALVFDLMAGEIIAKLPIASGSPLALAEFGHCLIVGSEESRIVSFFDLTTSDFKAVTQWDLSTLGKKFMGLRALSVDPSTRRVFARSTYPCNPMSESCPETRNGVAVAEEPSQETAKQCGLGG